MKGLPCHVGALALVFGLAACGQKSGGGHDSGPAMGTVEAAFTKAAKDTGVPMRFMMATGYLESGLAPQNATANYVSVGNGAQPVPRGTVMTQTAFGLTFDTLGLDPSKDESALLPTQIDAYAHYLQAQFAAAGVKLVDDPQTDEDKFYWIENLALIHRKGLAERRNVEILFGRELIGILNQGFVWQDPTTNERLELEKEAKPIAVDKFAPDGQGWFAALTSFRAQIDRATYLPLVTVPSGEFKNKPTHVEVIHCPLSLSGCLELQTRADDSDIHLAAHYMIPAIATEAENGDAVLNQIFQVADHEQAVVLTDDKGDNVPIENAVVIMLVGNSGRIVAGARDPAIPTWFTDSQLQAMGNVINDVCTLLAQNDATIDRDKCMATSGDTGVQFHHQAQSEEFHWGDIPDFDATIFDAYAANPGGLSTAVSFDFDKSNREFKAGDNIPLTVLFDSSSRQVALERLNRCSDDSGGRVVWEPVDIQQLNGEIKVTFSKPFYDSGPNRNGNQFFRARTYDKDGHLIGWAIDQVYLSGYDPTPQFASDEYCSGAP